MAEITLLNTESTYLELQPFADVAELNENTKAIRAEYGNQLTRATYDVLDVLARYACKYPGVCFLSKSKIAEEVGVTRRTVIRACKQLADFGIIEEHATKRAGGDRRQSSNAIVFVKLNVVTPGVTPECHTVNTPAYTPSKANTVNTSDTDAQVIHKAYLSRSLPEGWYEEAAPYAADYADLYAITGALFKGKHGTPLKVEDYVTEFGAVLRNSWAKLKNGMIDASKWHAYLFAAFRNTAQGILRAEKAAALRAATAGIYA